MLGLIKLLFHPQLVKEKIDDLKMVNQHFRVHVCFEFSPASIIPSILMLCNTGRASKHQHHDVQEQVVLPRESDNDHLSAAVRAVVALLILISFVSMNAARGQLTDGVQDAP